MSASARVVEPSAGSDEIQLSEWARKERSVIELFEAERLHAAALDPVLCPGVQSDIEWHILFDAWRVRERL